MGSDADDWAEVDDIVQHYCIRRALRRPPFHDDRPLPVAAAGADSPEPIPVLVINLERRADRRQFVDAHMKSIGYELFAATDGAALDLESEGGWRPMAGWALAPDDAALATIPGLMMRSHVPWWHSARYWTRPVSRGEMGCAISHVRAWEAIRDRALPAAAVLEDSSAIVAPRWPRFLWALDELDRSGFEWDVIYLGVGVWLGDRHGPAPTTAGPTPAFSVVSFTFVANPPLLGLSSHGMACL